MAKRNVCGRPDGVVRGGSRMVQDKDVARRERLKAALRENLKRRKAQGRARPDSPPAESPVPTGRDDG